MKDCIFISSPGLFFALPFSTVDSHVVRRSRHYPTNPQTLGEHLLKARLDLQLTKKAAAAKMEVSPSTIELWETDRSTPDVRGMKKVIEFIGYYPLQEPVALGEKIKKYRYIYGLSQDEFGILVDADGATVWNWENGKYTPQLGAIKKIESIVKD